MRLRFLRKRPFPQWEVPEPTTLRPLPPDGSTEAAAALLLAPEAVALRHRLKREASSYRPVKGTVAAHAKSLAQAHHFAGVKESDIKKNWHVGVSTAQRGLLAIAENSQGVTHPDVDIDQTIGVTGIAAPWVAIAHAHTSLRRGDGAAMITVGAGDEVSTMVLRPSTALRKATSTSSAC